MSKVIDGIRKDLQQIPKNLKEKARAFKPKKFLLLNFPYFLIAYFCNKLAWLYYMVDGEDVFTRLMNTMAQVGDALGLPVLSLNPKHLLFGIAGGAAMKYAVYAKSKNAKKMRKGMEYGSARWGKHYSSLGELERIDGVGKAAAYEILATVRQWYPGWLT